jgi:putative copper resistance protein D
MSLLLDLFGYLSVLVHGISIVAQSMALGGVLFLVALVRPLSLGVAGPAIRHRVRRLALFSALGLAASEAIMLALQGAVLLGTLDIGLGRLLSAEFAVASLTRIVAALLMAGLLTGSRDKAPASVLIGLGLVVLAAAALTTHAAARLDGRSLLLGVEILHQAGAALWIGGIPSFVVALGLLHEGPALARLGKRFSHMSMIGVAAIVISGSIMAWTYIGTLDGFYGTAYGVMVTAKIGMLLMLLGLGGMNYLLVERLRRDPNTPPTRLKRFAEAEIGIGFTLFFAAASVTSSPPAVDLVHDRATWAEIVERNTPVWPRLASPSRDDLTLPALQAQLDAQAAAAGANASPAFVPGSGDIPDRNAFDIEWSEYNHHWAGLFVLAIGILATANRAGVRWARHWPLLFLGLAAFLFIRSDPEVWPLGEEGFFESLRDVEVLQHRMFVLLLIPFALFEWRVRAGKLAGTKAELVFPLLSALGSALLLTHQHAIANVKDQLLIEVTHTPLALSGIVAAWARWLEIRLDPSPERRIFGWVWPLALVMVGLILLDYREA